MYSVPLKNSNMLKRKPCGDMTNMPDYSVARKSSTFDGDAVFPKEPFQATDGKSDTSVFFIMQNVHPSLPYYKHDAKSDHMSHEDLLSIIDPAKEDQLISMLQQCGVVSACQQCKFCGGNMRIVKDKTSFFWICTKRVDGVKCNRGKFSIFDGTFLSNKKLSLRNIMLMVWHFVHHLNEQQCKQYMSISEDNDKTIVKWYRLLREICGKWIETNPPKLGGFGKIVEMDESYFAGAPKYGKGRRLGEGSWDGFDKWGFALTERGSLDCRIEQVDASRSRKTLIPIINRHCLDGSIFCSDSWKAYNSLAEHLDLEDVLYFPVNHSENYLNPITGAHTQTVEGLWRHCKEFLPRFGMKPKDLGSYLGQFMWHRYAKQRKLDMFLFFLKCAAETYPPTISKLPRGAMSEI